MRSGLSGGIREEDDHDSLNERWHIDFTREDDEVTRITITPTDNSAPPQVLFGDNNETCPLPTFAVWSPDEDKIAISLGDGIRYRQSRIYRLVDSKLLAVEEL